MKLTKPGLVAAGFLLCTAGMKILGSKTAKKVYTQVTAAALRGKECVMTAVTNLRENAEDIVADAKDINEKREVAETPEIIEDASLEVTAE